MRKIILAGLVTAGFSLCGAIAMAGSFEDADAAYQREAYSEALKLLSPLAEQGHAGAQNHLALMNLNGLGMAKNREMGVLWLRLSANQGNSEAQSRLGHANFYGWDSPTADLAESSKWYRAAADQGHAGAQYNLGAMYENGFGVPQDYIEAMRWSILAIAAYPASAQESRRLAAVNRDRQAEKLTPEQIAEAEKRAREWAPAAFRPLDKDLFYDALMALEYGYKAMAARLMAPVAERGYAEAQEMLGGMYMVGEGVPENDAKAAELFRLAARQGQALAQDNLGYLYGNGSGVPKNFVRALMWRNLAAESDERVAKHSEKGRAALSAKMTPAQIAEAAELGKKCRVSNFKDCD